MFEISRLTSKTKGITITQKDYETTEVTRSERHKIRELYDCHDKSIHEYEDHDDFFRVRMLRWDLRLSNIENNRRNKRIWTEIKRHPLDWRDICSYLCRNPLSKQEQERRRHRIRFEWNIIAMEKGYSINAYGWNDAAIQQMAECIDRHFFDGLLSESLARRDPAINVCYRYSADCGRGVAGDCGPITPTQHQIRISRLIYSQLFQRGESGYSANGQIHTTLTDCLMSVMEHEMIHLIIQVFSDQHGISDECRGKEEYNPSETYTRLGARVASIRSKKLRDHGALFKEIAKTRFGHSEHTHRLNEPCSITKIEYKAGDIVMVGETHCVVVAKLRKNYRLRPYIPEPNDKVPHVKIRMYSKSKHTRTCKSDSTCIDCDPQMITPLKVWEGRQVLRQQTDDFYVIKAVHMAWPISLFSPNDSLCAVNKCKDTHDKSNSIYHILTNFTTTLIEDIEKIITRYNTIHSNMQKIKLKPNDDKTELCLCLK